MKILKINFKSKEISFICQTIEDLWIIKSISENGDLIKGSSYRRLKNDLTGDSERKPVFIEISIEKKDYSSTLKSLRFTGKIVSSKPQDFAPLGEYHTLDVSFNNKYTLIKKDIFQHQLDLLKNSNSLENKVLSIVLDDESCDIYFLSGIENKLLTSLKTGKHGKRYNQSFDFTPFFNELYSIISKYDHPLIISGPGDTKTRLASFLNEKYNLKSITVNISSVSKSSINELLSKRQVLKFFENSIFFKEKEMLERFKENLGKDNSLAVYSLKDVSDIIDTGACDFVLISYRLWEKELDNIQVLIKKAEKLKTKIHIVDSTNQEVINTLNSFGGIITVLRYKLFK